MTYETTSLFYLTIFMYIGLSVVFSRGPPYRASILSNKLYLFSLVAIIVVTICLMFFGPLALYNVFLIRKIPDALFLVVLLAMAFLYFGISLVFEIIFIENFSFWVGFIKCFKPKNHLKHFKISKALNGFLSSPKIKLPLRDKNIIISTSDNFHSSTKSCV